MRGIEMSAFERKYPAIRTMRYHSRCDTPNIQTLPRPSRWRRFWWWLTRSKPRSSVLSAFSFAGCFVECDFREVEQRVFAAGIPKELLKEIQKLSVQRGKRGVLP